MTEEMDNILRKSLNEVDRIRKRQWAYLALCFCCLWLFVWSMMVTAHNIGDAHLVAEVLIGAIISILTNILVVLGLSLFINRMTNKILKAIELSTRQ
ncbi:MAG: hypothetical protein ABSF68_13650 [Candidatus Acidiferrales bacterium]|jgi:hypothetical protein